MFCAKCGEQRPDTPGYCRKCGHYSAGRASLVFKEKPIKKKKWVKGEGKEIVKSEMKHLWILTIVDIVIHIALYVMLFALWNITVDDIKAAADNTINGLLNPTESMTGIEIVLYSGVASLGVGVTALVAAMSMLVGPAIIYTGMLDGIKTWVLDLYSVNSACIWTSVLLGIWDAVPSLWNVINCFISLDFYYEINAFIWCVLGWGLLQAGLHTWIIVLQTKISKKYKEACLHGT